MKPFGLAKDIETGKPLSYVFVALHDESGQRTNFTVSDEKGRYFLLSPKGSHILKAYTPAQVSPMRQIAVPIRTRKGWVSKIVKL